MDTKKIQAWLSQHKFEVGLFALVLGVIGFIAIRNKSSSNTAGKGKATLDTLHNDLVAVDFDLNQLMTSGVSNPWVSNLGAPAQPPAGNIPSQAIATSASTTPASQTLTGLDIAAIQDYANQLNAGALSGESYLSPLASNLYSIANEPAGSALTGQQEQQLAVAYANLGSVPNTSQTTTGTIQSILGRGEDRPQSNYTWAFRGMGLEGQSLPSDFYADEYHQLEPVAMGIWGDYDNPVRLN